MARHNQKNRLEDIFELAEDYIHKPAVSQLRPGLIAGTTRETGNDSLLKIWWKTGDDADGEFRELWNHERLQVERVMNYPDADEVMVGIVEMLETSDAFCVVYEAGAVPLAAKIRHLPRHHWLNALDVASSRAILWGNLARLSKALGIIHARGLIHGRIDNYAVFTDGSISSDFKLGGFEWSVGIRETQPLDPLISHLRARIDHLIYSYSDDWKALGVMFAGFLGLDPYRLRDDDPFLKNARVLDLSEAEIDFLRRLIDPSREDALDARSINRTVDTLTRELASHGATQSARFVLLTRLNNRMAEAIQKVTDGDIGLDDLDSQIAFVEGDLATGAKIVISERNDVEPFESLTIVTDTLSYLIRPFSDDGPQTWKIAIVVSIRPRPDVRLPSDREIYVLPHEIIVTRNKFDAAATLSRLRSQAIEWTVPIAPTAQVIEDPDSQALRRSVLLVQVVDALVKVLDILPIRILSRYQEGGRTILRIAPREGNVRDAMAAELGERSTADVMDRLFEKEDSGVDIDWRLSTSGALSPRRASELKARFISVDRGPDGASLYEFEIFDVMLAEDDLFLRRSGDVGTEALIRRRLRTTRALNDQRDLTALFLDPRRGSRKSKEAFIRDNAFEALDTPKQEALAAIWTTLPNHFVVGPPGVGKTRLSAELVRRRLETEPASRILLSAQSHQALDHLLDTVRKKSLDGNKDAIIVRSRGTEETVSTDEDIRKTALTYLDRILESKLLAEAPRPLRANLEALKAAAEYSEKSNPPDPEERALNKLEEGGLRALEALVLESANVVFSTSNSLDVERLADDGAQFDWVIIEEAAKATGPDLIAPLSLGGRRLLIGDHHQLPPFDAERLRAILGNKTAISNALKDADAVIGSTFFESGLDELQRALKDEVVLDGVSTLALRMLEPFRTLVEEDQSRRAEVGGQRRAITSELLCQHRMDPSIARLVSSCFYRERLNTGDERLKEATRPLPFTFGEDFPTAPIVFLDMPFVSRSGKSEPIEFGRPRWHNPTEIRVVSELLKRLRPVSETPHLPHKANTIAVLSPYRAQVERLQRKIDALRADKASSLGAFQGFTADGRMYGTVDSSQGSEADLVIVSLVRNNHRTGVSALGFLRDPRRMNVLLSRAKLQLILVGSLEFLKESTRYAPTSEEADLAFIRKLTKTLDALSCETAPRGETCAAIVKVTDVFGGGFE